MGETKQLSTKMKIAVLTILIFFLTICICTSIYYGEKLLLGSFENFDNDDVKYLRSADTFLKTGHITYKYTDIPTVYIMPGIVMTLVPFVKIFGLAGAVIPVRIFNAVIMTLMLYLLFLIAMKTFDVKVAFLTLICNIFYLPNIYASTQILTEPVFTFLLMMLILVSIYMIKYKRKKYCILLGIILGIAINFRASIVLYPVILLILWIKERYSLNEILKFLGIICAFVIIAVMPWWVRNYMEFDTFIPFTKSSGNPVLQGAFIKNKVDHKLITELNYDNLKYQDEISTNSVEKILAKRVIKHNFRNNFFRYVVWNTLGKTVINFATPFCWYPLYGEINLVIQVALHYLFAFLGVVGAILTITKSDNMYQKMILSVILYFIIIHLAVLAYSRYMYPIMPLVILLGMSIFKNKGVINEKFL